MCLHSSINIIFHILYIIVTPLCAAFPCQLLQRKARHALIGQIYGALWLAEYLKRVMEMLRPLTIFGNTQRLHDNNTTARIKATPFFA